MSIPQRINDFITKGGDLYCDRCIQDSLKIARHAQVQPVTATLATTSEFKRTDGICSICKDTKLVIGRVF